MTSSNGRNAFFVGSIPGEDVEQVLKRAARLGEHAYAFPDGEVGLRQFWIAALGPLAFDRHPDIEKLEGDALPFGVYAVREGAGKISFDEVFPYGKIGLESYATFKRLRDSGELPASARFQVSIPSPDASIRAFFLDSSRWDELMEAWGAATHVAYQQLLSEIPAEDLVIQIDYAVEMAALLGDELEPEAMATGLTYEQTLAKYTGPEYTGWVAKDLPEDVTFGWHICLGTWPHWPRIPQEDLSKVVEIANGLIGNTPRRVDFMHLPVMADADDSYFAPLTGLTEGPDVFLGLECKDGYEAMERRMDSAKKYLDDFGVAHFCGYGRDTEENIEELIDVLAKGAATL